MDKVKIGLIIKPNSTLSSSFIRTPNLQHPDQGEKMENSQIVLKEKLEVSGILKEALKIPLKCPKFIILVLLTSLPMFCIMLLHEFILQNTMVETKAFLTPPPPPPNGLLSGDFYIISYTQWEYWSYFSPLGITIKLVQDMSPRLLQLGILYLVPLHLLDLLNTITTLHSASAIYSGDTSSLTLVDMLYGSLIKTSFKGALITSIYVLFLNSFTLLGLIWAGTNSILTFPFFMVVYGVGSVVLFVKWMDWSAVWNMSIVFSILGEGEEKHGVEAFWAALYFSRGSRKRGICLMLVFFVWRTGLRLLCLYVGGYEKWAGLVATSAMSCLGNVLKWVVCMVYFYDCKARILEKKMDVEEGGEKKNGAL